MTEPRWTGFVRRCGDGIHGVLKDRFGMTTELVGTPATVDGIPGYSITARLIEVPASLALPFDEEYGISVTP